MASQLEQESQAERAVLAEPERRAEVVADLSQVQQQTRRLSSPTATWQQTLSDGIQDLVADVEHDLQARLRTVIHDVEEIIDQGDPKDAWADTEVWLRRQVAIVTVANRDMLMERAEELTRTVAEEFDLEAETGIALHLEAVGEALDAVALASASSLAHAGRQAGAADDGRPDQLLRADHARRSGRVRLLAGGCRSCWPIAGISLSLGAGIGRKIIADERKRQRTYRQQQAKAAVRRFVDEIAFIMNKQTRDGLRSTQRQLRDDFQARAMLMDRSAGAGAGGGSAGQQPRRRAAAGPSAGAGGRGPPPRPGADGRAGAGGRPWLRTWSESISALLDRAAAATADDRRTRAAWPRPGPGCTARSGWPSPARSRRASPRC